MKTINLTDLQVKFLSSWACLTGPVPRLETVSGTLPHSPSVRNRVRHTTSQHVIFCIQNDVLRQMPLLTFSVTAITDPHHDTTISNSENTGCVFPGLMH